MSLSCWFCREWENHPYDVEIALPFILQKSGRFVPPYIIGISSIRLNWVASIPYIPHFLKHQQCWFSMIQYLEDKANSVDSQHLPKSDDVTSPPGFWIHHVEDMPKARSGPHAWVGRRRRSNFPVIEGLLPTRAPMTPWLLLEFWRTFFRKSCMRFTSETNLFPKKVFKLNPWMGSQNGKVALPNHQFLAEPRSPQWFRISETHFSSPKTWP